MPNTCGDFWFLCGPSFDMRTPGYWAGSLLSWAVTFYFGYRAGKATKKNHAAD